MKMYVRNRWVNDGFIAAYSALDLPPKPRVTFFELGTGSGLTTAWIHWATDIVIGVKKANLRYIFFPVLSD